MDNKTKTCNWCKETKPISEFYKDKRNKDGLRGHCIACHKAYLARYRDTNKEKLKKSKAEYFQRTKEATFKIRKQRGKEYYNKNKERILAYFREHEKLYRERRLKLKRLWRSKNRLRNISTVQRSRARMNDRFVEDVNFTEICIRDNWICGVCGKKVDINEASMDHITPYSRGGTHEPNNVQLTHLTCNRHKSFRLPHELNKN